MTKKYAILHIPTSSFLMFFDSKKNIFIHATFASKAQAGHAREDYRLQSYEIRSYSGNGLFLEEDVKGFNIHTSSLWNLRISVKNKFEKYGKFRKTEFEFIEVDDDSVTSLEIKTSKS